MICPTCSTHNPNGAPTCRSCGTPLGAGAAPTAHTLPVGTQLQHGSYSVGRVLGQGGFGITYLGTETRLRRLIAIKEFFPYGCARHGRSVHPSGGITAADYGGALARFLEEACLLARFQHAGIVRVHAAFEENDTAYMAMEYVKGRTLLALLAERGKLPEPEAVRYVEKVGEALAVVHGEGLLHRDLKPENIMLTAEGRVVLLDFGSARVFAAGKTKRMTQIVTPGYAPLEQYGQQARFGPFTDVYALGATLYHLLTGEIPVQAVDRAAGVELATPRRLNPAVSASVSEAVMAALAMKVSARPQSVAEFTAALRKKRGPGNTRKPPEPPPNGTQAPEPSDPKLDPKRERRLEGHVGRVSSVAFHPDGSLLASAGQDGSVRLWSVSTGKEVRRLTGHTGAAWDLAFSPDGTLLATGGDDQTVRLWDVAAGRETRRLAVGAEAGTVWSLAFSPDARLLAAGCEKQRARVWDLAGGKCWDLVGHAGGVWALAFSPDGKMLASGSEDEGVFLWHAERLRQGRTNWWSPSLIQAHLKPAEACGKQNAAKIRERAVLSVAFSPDSRLIASGSWDGMIRLWDVASKTEASRLQGHTSTVPCVAYSPNGRLLASASNDETVRLWDLTSRTMVQRMIGHQGAVWSVAFSPDGKRLATGGTDQTVRLWTVDEP